MKKTGEDYPCGPCELPLECSGCGTILTNENVIYERCEEECEVCEYCSISKCPTCTRHICCGGCI